MNFCGVYSWVCGFTLQNQNTTNCYQTKDTEVLYSIKVTFQLSKIYVRAYTIISEPHFSCVIVSNEMGVRKSYSRIYLFRPTADLNVFSRLEMRPTQANLPCKDEVNVSERKGIIRTLFHTKDKKSLIILYPKSNKRD